jgi:uncharacterized protein (DUF362 family)
MYGQTQQPTVVLIQGHDRYTNVSRALETIADEVDLSGVRSVLIKPNFVVTDRPLASTHVDSVRAVLEFVRARYSGPVTIGEGSANADVTEAYERFGYRALAEQFDAELVNLNDDEGVEVTAFRWNMRPQTLRLARRVVTADYRISVGPPKTHDTVIVTLSLKNMIMGSLLSPLGVSRNGRLEAWKDYRRWLAWLRKLKLNRLFGTVFAENALFLGLRAGYFGILVGGRSDKVAMHQGFRVMNLNLARLAPYVYPHLSVIDGFQGMEGAGPTQGRPVDWKIAIASTDWLAADRLTAWLMGYDPEEIGYLYYCTQLGMGVADREQINVVGNVSPEEVQRPFAPHPSYRWQRRWRMRDALARLQGTGREGDSFRTCGSLR